MSDQFRNFLHIEEAKKQGFMIDLFAAGRPLAFKGALAHKGPKYADEVRRCYTELETKLITALSKAIDVYGYASMTQFEREATAEDGKLAEDTLALVRELP